jgi:hypothetical protein
MGAIEPGGEELRALTTSIELCREERREREERARQMIELWGRKREKDVERCQRTGTENRAAAGEIGARSACPSLGGRGQDENYRADRVFYIDIYIVLYYIYIIFAFYFLISNQKIMYL